MLDSEASEIIVLCLIDKMKAAKTTKPYSVRIKLPHDIGEDGWKLAGLITLRNLSGEPIQKMRAIGARTIAMNETAINLVRAFVPFIFPSSIEVET